MVTRVGGIRRKSRGKLTGALRARGKISVTKRFLDLSPGEKVVLKLDPSVHQGFFHTRFHGRVGTVLGRRGRCYEVRFKDINKEKIVVAHPAHLKKI